MITNVSREQLVQLGRGVSVRRMIDQAEYTLELVSMDPKMAGALGLEFLTETRAGLASLRSAVTDHSRASARASKATVEQDRLLEAARMWRTAFVREARSAFRQGLGLPAEATSIMEERDHPGRMAADVERLVALGQEHAADFARAGVPSSFLEEGADLARALVKADREQEALLRVARHAMVTRVRELVGLVYTAVKRILDAAPRVHRSDPDWRKAYRLVLMYGGARPSGPPPPPPDATSPPTSVSA